MTATSVFESEILFRLTGLEITCCIQDLSFGYGRSFLFNNLNLEISSGCIHLITGLNGSGKSTLLRLLSTAIEPVKGSIRYQMGKQFMELETMWQQIALIAPYQELPEEFTLNELISLQRRFSPSAGGTDAYQQVSEYFGIASYGDRLLRDFSTGMKQKARFVLAFGSGRPVWLLDEPGSNLDTRSVELLHAFLLEKCGSHLIIMASNDPAEISLGVRLLEL